MPELTDRIAKLPLWARDYIDKTKYALRKASALRFTSPVEPDIEPPTEFRVIKKGWLFNSYNNTVAKACTSAIHHSYGQDDKTDTQGSRRLYSTKFRALLALRCRVENDCAAALARIDDMIEQAETESIK
jgi:hypothetical protein